MRFQLFRLFGVIALVPLFVLPATSINADSETGSEKQAAKQKLQEALTIVRDPELQKKDPDRVIGAIQQLGELRDPAAVDDLIRLLPFRRQWPWETDPTKKVDASILDIEGLRYPAVIALTQIGEPCVPALLKVIETHEFTSLESRNALEVLIYLSRDKRAEYIERLNEEAAKASSPEAAQRLLRAAEALKESKR